MSNPAKVLLIVEGETLEPTFFNQLAKVYDMKVKIYSLNTNIYALYKELEKLNFDCDVKAVLAERHSDQKELLSQQFAYTYLIFDCDAHHTEKAGHSCKEKNIDEIVNENLSKLQEMAAFFTDETDPGKGKLYINYPMMESFRDCNDFFDAEYAENYVSIDKIATYKIIAGKKRHASLHLKYYTKDNFEQLIRMNVYKANKLVNGVWHSMDYKQYQADATSERLLQAEIQNAQNSQSIGVLNTSLFLTLDYYGNKNGYYDSVVNNYS